MFIFSVTSRCNHSRDACILRLYRASVVPLCGRFLSHFFVYFNPFIIYIRLHRKKECAWRLPAAYGIHNGAELTTAGRHVIVSTINGRLNVDELCDGTAKLFETVELMTAVFHAL